MDRLDRLDRRFVDAIDGALRPLIALTGLDGGVFAVLFGLAGSGLLTATTAVLVRTKEPGDVAGLGLAVAAIGAVTVFEVLTIWRQVRAARRANADGYLVTDPNAPRRLAWLALPLLVLTSLPGYAVVGFATAGLLLAAGYAAAGRCRPGGRRRRARAPWGATSRA